jgi:hypothetical protein
MRVVAVAVLVVALCAASGAWADLLQNSGFETDDGTGWAQNWGHWNFSSRQNWGDAVRSGSYGAYFEGWQTGGASFWQQVNQSVGVGEVVNFSIYANTGSGWDGTAAELKLEFYDAGGNSLGSQSQNILSTLTANRGVWTQVGITYTNTLSGVASVRPDIYANWNAQGGGGMSVGWDDASLQVIPEPTVMGLVGLGGLFAVYARRKARRS